MSQVLIVYNFELTKEFEEVAIGVVDHQVECQLLEHDFFVCQDAISPSPILLALLVDDEFGVLLGDFGNGDDDVLCLSAVFFDFVR